MPINVVEGGLRSVNIVVTLTGVDEGLDEVATTTMIPDGVVSTVSIPEYLVLMEGLNTM